MFYLFYKEASESFFNDNNILYFFKEDKKTTQSVILILSMLMILNYIIYMYLSHKTYMKNVSRWQSPRTGSLDASIQRMRRGAGDQEHSFFGIFHNSTKC